MLSGNGVKTQQRSYDELHDPRRLLLFKLYLFKLYMLRLFQILNKNVAYLNCADDTPFFSQCTEQMNGCAIIRFLQLKNIILKLLFLLPVKRVQVNAYTESISLKINALQKSALECKDLLMIFRPSGTIVTKSFFKFKTIWLRQPWWSIMAEEIEMIKDNNSNKAASSNDGAKQQ